MTKIILATESTFKRQLFDRLALNYTAISPKIDETPKPSEHAKALSIRLAIDKTAVFGSEPQSTLIIGCDQAPVSTSGRILSKPGTPENAIKELERLSGETITFYTTVAVLRIGETPAKNQLFYHTDETFVTYKTLLSEQIERYINKEEAWRCAGAVQSESLGISLLSCIKTLDPTALIGLPLIGLTTLLYKAGITVP